ncbi:MAG: OmpA family protein, partial [Rhodospirillaceae bacterium]|nr:OmpA family protein [Rhodospirillaceae bacterium]
MFLKIGKNSIIISLMAIVISACAAKTENMSAGANAVEIAQYGEAINHFRDLVKQKPDELEAYLGLSRNLRWAGGPDEAATVLEKVKAKFADNGAYLAELGKVRINQGMVEQGVNFLSMASEKNPDDWRLHSALGVGFDYLAFYGDAQKSYKRALDLCPDDAAVMNNMAISQGLSGNIDKAIITLETALSYGRHSEKIAKNLKVFKDARDLCSTCGGKYLRDSKAGILAAGLRTTDDRSACDPEPEFTQSANAMAEELTVAPSINIKVYFEFDSAILRPETKGTLDDLASALNSDALKGYRFEIAGHTDAVGSNEYNQTLSEQRARAVLDYLVTEFGIDAGRL